MKMLRVILICAFFVPVSAMAARRSDIPARIALKDQSGVVEVVLTGRKRDTIHARLKSADTGSITFEADDIKRIAVSVSEGQIQKGEALIAAGRGQEGLRMIRSAVRPVIAYLDLPIEGAVDPALRYAAAARQEKAWAEAIKVYEMMEGNPDGLISDEGKGWMAYCYMKNLQPKKAQEWIEAFEDEDPRNPGFVPVVLAEALLKYSEGDSEAALDLAARVSSLARISHELYAEAIMLSADAYYAMSKKDFAGASDDDVVLRRGSGEEAPTPPMYPEEFLSVATNQYTRVMTLFPKSTFAGKASNTLEKINLEQLELEKDLKPTVTGETP